VRLNRRSKQQASAECLPHDDEERIMTVWMIGYSTAVCVNFLMLVTLASQGNLLMIVVLAVVLGWLTAVLRDQVKTWKGKR
jgi:hypothetical protein